MIKKRELDDRVRQLESMYTPLDEQVQELEEALTNQEHSLAVYIKKVNELEAQIGALSRQVISIASNLSYFNEAAWLQMKRGPDVHG